MFLAICIREQTKDDDDEEVEEEEEGVKELIQWTQPGWQIGETLF